MITAVKEIMECYREKIAICYYFYLNRSIQKMSLNYRYNFNMVLTSFNYIVATVDTHISLYIYTHIHNDYQ